jgi:hypothetical protein
MNLNTYIIESVKTGGKNEYKYGGKSGNKTNEYELLTNTNMSECACKVSSGGSNVDYEPVCSSKNVIFVLSDFIVDTSNEKKEYDDSMIVKRAKEILNCDSESCILSNDKFNKYVIDKTGDNRLIKNELDINFKTKGPRDSTNLLNNNNIDETLLRWSREFPHFYNCPFSMIDFKETDNEFHNINMSDIILGNVSKHDPVLGHKRSKFKTLGCVLNTDTSRGHGKHWICVFVCCRFKAWTIEFFNSSGNSPCRDIVEWMEKQRKYLKAHNNNVDTVTVSQFVHQKGDTECGMYALYYIRSRLEEVPYTVFMNKRIADDEVTHFRKHVFRKY